MSGRVNMKLRRFLLALLVAALLRGPAAHAQQVTIYRDHLGVPSIAAGSLSDGEFGLGYAMASDNAVQMARNFKQARGRFAEIEGRALLLQDGFLRALGIEEMAERRAESLPPDEAEVLKSFCAGANRALAERKDRLPEWIAPFTPVDVLALAQMLNAAFPLEDLAHQLLPSTGSNQFAISPARTANGHAILSADPHLPWNGIFAWYAFALYTPEFNFRGVTMPGLPFGVLGHTDRVAWCFTNNNPMLYTFYTVDNNPNNPNQYNFHGQMRDYETVPVDLQFRDGGQMKTMHQTVRRTAWGPMLPFRNQAVKLSMIGDWSILHEAQMMARAKDAAEFREALRPLGLSMWNIVYADVKGSIGYQFNARVPHLDAAFDWKKPVPGSDPRTAWGPLWSIDDLPHVENPKSGLLVNANSAPWLTTIDNELPENGWPRYVTSYGHTSRYDRLAQLLEPQRHISAADAKRIATDTQVPYALQTVQVLRQVRDNNAGGGGVGDALAVLSRWNGRSDIDSRGCALYLYWGRIKGMAILARKAGHNEAWSGDEVGSALAALKEAADALIRDHTQLDVPWGELHFAERGKVRDPVSGFGNVASNSEPAVVPNYGAFKDGAIHCQGGSSFRMIVDLDPNGVHSWSILPYGDSGDPANPHYADQLPLFGQGEYADTLFGLDRIRKAATSKETITIR